MVITRQMNRLGHIQCQTLHSCLHQDLSGDAEHNVVPKGLFPMNRFISQEFLNKLLQSTKNLRYNFLYLLRSEIRLVIGLSSLQKLQEIVLCFIALLLRTSSCSSFFAFTSVSVFITISSVSRWTNYLKPVALTRLSAMANRFHLEARMILLWDSYLTTLTNPLLLNEIIFTACRCWHL